MSEEDQDRVFRGAGNICAPAAPLPMMVGLYMQQQLLQSSAETMRTILRCNPFIRSFMQ